MSFPYTSGEAGWVFTCIASPQLALKSEADTRCSYTYTMGNFIGLIISGNIAAHVDGGGFLKSALSHKEYVLTFYNIDFNS
jgi:hypothetical protein